MQGRSGLEATTALSLWQDDDDNAKLLLVSPLGSVKTKRTGKYVLAIFTRSGQQKDDEEVNASWCKKDWE